MKYKDFEDAFSAARLNKYKNACGGDTNKALTLYRHNVKLCQKFYGVLNIFEIILRNAINQHYAAHFNDADWIYHQLQSGGMLEHSPHQHDTLNDITAMVAKGKYTPDKVVASVSFGTLRSSKNLLTTSCQPLSTSNRLQSPLYADVLTT